MLSRTRKKIDRGTHKQSASWALLCAYLFLLGTVSTDTISAATSYSEKHRNVLYAHSFFSDKHWRTAGDTIVYDTAASFCALTPTQRVATGLGNTNIVWFAASNNKTYLMKAVVTPPATSFDNCLIQAGDPVECPAGTASTPTTLINLSANMVDTVILAVASGFKVLLYKIASATFTISKMDTLSLSGAGTITGLWGGPSQTIGSSPSCLWATGSAGLVRYFSYNGASWSSETKYDLTDNESVTALCKSALGTQSGKIYEFQSNSFVYKSTPASTPINAISASGAVGNAGIIIRKKGTLWNAYTQGTADYGSFNFIARSDGFGVEVLDKAFNYSIYTLSDTTTFFTVTPDSLVKYINGSNYIFTNYKPQDISIRLRDSDGNYKIPSMQVSNGGNLLIGSSQTLESTHPDTGCVPGFTDLTDTMVQITLNSSSITLSAKSRKAVFNTIAGRYQWSFPQFQNSVNWSNNTVLTITLNGRTLKITNLSQTTEIESVEPVLSERSISIKKNGTTILFSFPKNMITSITLLNLQGRRLSSTLITPDQQTILFQPNVSSGILCTEILLKNGAVIHNTIPLIK